MIEKKIGGIIMAAAAKRRTTNRSGWNRQYRYATDGNAARQLAPASAPERRRRSSGQQVRRKKKTQQVKVKSRLRNPFSLFLFGMAIVVTIYICIQYVQLQTEIIVHLKNINTYEVELNDLIAQNDELEASINSYMDLQHIYQVATEELGMTYPKRGQISEYENSGSEYVRQYGSIPEVPKTPITVK